MPEHLDTRGALRAIAEGRLVPPSKYAALQRAALIRVRGHGNGSRAELTEAGRERLASPPPRAQASVRPR